YLLTVGDLDRSLAFYRDVLGLTVLRAATAAGVNPDIERLTSTPGALFHSAALQLPDAAPPLVLMQFTRVDRRRLRPHLVDPGAVMLDVRVAQLDGVIEAARRFGTQLLTPADRFVTPGGAERSVVLIDPDGFYVRVRQTVRAPEGTAASAAGDGSAAARLVFTVAEPGPVLRFYRGVLGLSVESGAPNRDRDLDRLIGAPGAHRTLLRTRAGDAELQFAVYTGVPRHTYLLRPQDPGAAGASLRVADLAAAMRRIRAAGVRIVSAGGQPVLSAQHRRAILIRDPAGLLLELVQR
ncbi:MAG TPA: VOC family protein, partial [Steroidobacteraceae bacterium]|nr:VOC family protein [Steroidobacteraceae bacterium]